ncbi:MAG: hypothetical protein JXR05_10795 [Flavobacteriaceae bacterium]
MATKKALLIIRHAHDLPKEADSQRIPNPNPDYTLPNSKTVKVSYTRLTQKGNDYGNPPAGEIQANNLGKSLSSWMANPNVKTDIYYEIGKVFVQDPMDGSWDSTPNPFNTIYPVIDPAKHPEVKNKPIDVNFYGNQVDLEKKKIFDDGNYSTLLCATRQVIWGHKEQDHKHPENNHTYPDKGTFMDFIADASTKEVWEKLKHEPSKCKAIYVFTDFNEETHKFANLEVFTLDGDSIS